MKLATGCYLELDMLGPQPVGSVCVDTVVVKLDIELLPRLKAVDSDSDGCDTGLHERPLRHGVPAWRKIGAGRVKVGLYDDAWPVILVGRDLDRAFERASERPQEALAEW